MSSHEDGRFDEDPRPRAGRVLLVANCVFAVIAVSTPVYTVTDEGVANQNVTLFVVWTAAVLLSAIATVTAFVAALGRKSRVAWVAVAVGLVPWVMVFLIATHWLSQWAGGRSPFYNSD